ncbi:hypothetical protein Q0590_05045 [Rhodocytophaga aerolata]|uniref:Outer membrane beta-barrel protein n=1 Tax=Rhodocytophaga aerolata TaxID=455078 RepID=A0ABT8R4D7_9BACT|nr:hypothetical protein [Rhodocytophaga aerolata]MDO1445602.1 hypothetical protein [Rhodocytophaga aerolata]
MIKVYLLYLPAMVFILLLTVSSASAQRNLEDVLYLKNGSMLRGKITELSADTISIEIVGGSVFVFPSSEAKGISREKKLVRYKESGYMFVLETGLLAGKRPGNSLTRANESINSFTLQCINGHEFRPELALGIGTGIDSYQNFTILPVYLRLSGSFPKVSQKFSPMYIVDGGYGFYSRLFNGNNITNGNGGLMLNPAAGVRIRLSNSSSFILNAGYRFQKGSTANFFGTPGDGIREKITFNRVSIRAGFMF